MSILLGITTFILILVSLFLILIVLAQKAKSDGGMGAAMGGGMAEAAFGAETGNVLSGATIKASIAFFVLSFLLYLGNVYQHRHAVATGGLPNIPTSSLPAAPANNVPAATAPAATTPAPAVGAPASATPAPTTSVPAAANDAGKK